MLRRRLAPGLALLLLPLATSALLAQQAAPYAGQYSQPYQPYGYPPPQSYQANPSYGKPSPYGGTPVYGETQPYQGNPQPYQDRGNLGYELTSPDRGQPDYGQQPQYGQAPDQQQPYDSSGGSYPQPSEPSPQPSEQSHPPLAPDQLEQLVAPIALYPDALLAQVLAASTYPDQIIEADHWRQAQGDASPYAIAAGANEQPWDPSIKALTTFPQVLAQLDQNLQWTTELGNAYYNQPQDVFDSVQALRQRAQAAGNLQSTPQETVTDNQGYIDVAPANPQVVYVPAYNPWAVYGQPVAPFPGFSLLGAIGSLLDGSPVRFGLGMVMSAFTPMSWGWLGWGLSWLGHALLFHGGGYYSQSRTLVDWGLPHGGPRAYWGRNEMARGGFDRDRGYSGGGYDRGYDRGYQHAGGYYGGRSEEFGQNSGRFAAHPAAEGYRGSGYAGYYGRTPQQAYNRMPAFNARSSYGRPTSRYGAGSYGAGASGRPTGGYGAGYGSQWRGRSSGSYGYRSYGHPAQNYSQPQTMNRGYGNAGRQPQSMSSFRGGSPSYRASTRSYGESAFGRGNFNAGSSRGFGGFSGGSMRSSGSHSLGGGHAEKGFSGGGHFGGGGGHFGGGHFGGGGGHFGGGHSGGHSGGHGGGGHHH